MNALLNQEKMSDEPKFRLYQGRLSRVLLYKLVHRGRGNPALHVFTPKVLNIESYECYFIIL